MTIRIEMVETPLSLWLNQLEREYGGPYRGISLAAREWISRREQLGLPIYEPTLEELLPVWRQLCGPRAVA